MTADIDPVPFGYLPFDGYVTANWNPESPLSRKKQQRSLVESWTRMGKYGRNKYQEFMNAPDEFPPHAPQDLMTDKDRSCDGQLTRAFWIRTWYGCKDDQESQHAADAAYERLRFLAIQEGDEDGEDCLESECIFDDPTEFGLDSAATLDEGDDKTIEFVDGVALGTPGSVPSYLITALMHYPDTFDGISDSDWRHLTAREEEAAFHGDSQRQSLLVCVADRKACEEGWVLYLAVNHQGQILRFRLRDRASWVTQWIANWKDGQSLQENTRTPDEDVEYYMHQVDGWGPL